MHFVDWGLDSMGKSSTGPAALRILEGDTVVWRIHGRHAVVSGKNGVYDGTFIFDVLTLPHVAFWKGKERGELELDAQG